MTHPAPAAVVRKQRYQRDAEESLCPAFSEILNPSAICSEIMTRPA